MTGCTHRIISRFACATMIGLIAVSAPCVALANYACSGLVSYLGVDSGGYVVVQLAGATPIHHVCNVNTQGSYEMPVASCKIAFGILMTAKLTGKQAEIYYDDAQGSCGAIPNWGYVTSAYFIDGPN